VLHDQEDPDCAGLDGSRLRLGICTPNSLWLVEFVGAQRAIFETGKADGVLSLQELKARDGLYAIGPVKDLDGEITIFGSQPSISKVRGSGFAVDRSWNHDAIFLVWSQQKQWRDVAIPTDVKGYLDLQGFIKTQADAAGIDTGRPFPFLITDQPIEIAWHINVDRSEGKPITPELFAKSKTGYFTRGEAVDIVGFYSEQHTGVFISKYAPAVPAGSDKTNAIHLHFVSHSSEATGHIDNIVLGDKATLRLPLVPSETK
jgi:acetolactate decarboxylase